MKQIPVDKYPKIFSVEFDAQYLVKMINIFDVLLKEKQIDDEGLEFIARYLKSKLYTHGAQIMNVFVD